MWLWTVILKKGWLEGTERTKRNTVITALLLYPVGGKDAYEGVPGPLDPTDPFPDCWKAKNDNNLYRIQLLDEAE